MPAPTTVIKLAEARAIQLRAIANTNECTVTEAVELLIKREIKAGRLKDDLPGFEVHTGHNHVCISIGKIGLPPLPPKHARDVAGLFELAADKLSDGKGKAVDLNKGYVHTLSISRKGRGIVGRVVCDEMEVDQGFSMTPGMARDFARHIRRAADAA